MQNTPEQFGIEQIPEILEIQKMSDFIHVLLIEVMIDLGLDDQAAHEIAKLTLETVQQANDVIDYEEQAREHFNTKSFETHITSSLKARAKLIVKQILPHLLFPGKTLDLGCGDGQVGEILAKKGFKMQLADVYKNPRIDDSNLKHTMLAEGKNLPFKREKFDNVLLNLVLHHSDDPDYLLKEAKRVLKPNGKIILIESVYGVDEAGLSPHLRQNSSFFLRLNAIQQRFSNVFFDHFYNRVLHYSKDPSKKVNVPCNFDTPEGWKARFKKAGLEQVHFEHLGLDHPIVPEWHTLHVVKNAKKKL